LGASQHLGASQRTLQRQRIFTLQHLSHLAGSQALGATGAHAGTQAAGVHALQQVEQRHSRLCLAFSTMHPTLFTTAFGTATIACKTGCCTHGQVAPVLAAHGAGMGSTAKDMLATQTNAIAHTEMIKLFITLPPLKGVKKWACSCKPKQTKNEC